MLIDHTLLLRRQKRSDDVHCLGKCNIQELNSHLNNDTPLTSSDFNEDDVVNSEVIEHTPIKNDRSAARYVALQVLYEVDSSGHLVGEVLNEQLSLKELNMEPLKIEELTEQSKQLLQTIVQGVLENKKTIDRTIQHFATEWPLEQVAIVDRNILRIAIYEFALTDLTKAPIAIDEAVRLAKWFGSDGSPRFINGVLGTVASDLATVKKQLAGKEDI